MKDKNFNNFIILIIGFADVRSFTTEFATHLESFFNQIVSYYPNLKVFRDVSIAFKSLRLSGPESFEIRQDVQLNADFVASQTRNDLAKLLEKLRIGLLMYHEADLYEKKEKKEKKEEEENIDKIEHRIFDYDGNYRIIENLSFFFFYDHANLFMFLYRRKAKENSYHSL